MIKQFQSTGRRISTTASEEEAMQPSRSRQRLVDEGYDGRPSLPSLDTLGLGLPHVARLPLRRPVTAPAGSSPFSSLSSSRRSSEAVGGSDDVPPYSAVLFSLSPPRPGGFGSAKHGIYPPSPYPQNAEDGEDEETLSSERFAFSVKREGSLAKVGVKSQ